MQRIAGRGQLQFTRHRNHLGVDDRKLRREAFRGVLKRLRSGAYVPTAVWDSLDEQARMRLEAAAAHDVGRGAFIASHATAAALWEIPRIGQVEGLVHARTTRSLGTRTENGVRKHAVEDLDLHLVSVHGIPCTSLERTVVDLAMTEPFADAVVAADWAVREHTSKAALRQVLDEVAPKYRRQRADRVIEFCSPRSGSAGESLSRVVIAEHGFPAPLLQHRFDDHLGLVGYVDFYWPDFALIGEFDGLVKYSSPSMLKGRTPVEVLVAEKVREDRLRALGPRVTRWIWDALRTDGALAAQLQQAGLRR